MRFQNSLIALVAAAGLDDTVNARSIPNGDYTVKVLDNGTTIYKALYDTTATPIVIDDETTQLSVRDGNLAKRGTDFSCWDYQLDVSGIDGAAEGLRNWAGSGTTLTSGDGNVWIEIIRGDVMVYYCINAHDSQGNLDRTDVDYALTQMDAKCRHYEASWFGWYDNPSSNVLPKFFVVWLDFLTRH
jgi:hypothetical protein